MTRLRHKRPLDEFGGYALAVLMETGLDAGDRLGAMVREAVRLRLARENVQAGDTTDPWVVPFPPGFRSRIRID